MGKIFKQQLSHLRGHVVSKIQEEIHAGGQQATGHGLQAVSIVVSSSRILHTNVPQTAATLENVAAARGRSTASF